MLATRYGLKAIDMVHHGEFGCMAALRGNSLIAIPLADALSKNRTVTPEMIEVAEGILAPIEAHVLAK
jgi:6-phosphofructokinase 1